MTLDYGNQGGKKRKRKDSGERDTSHDYSEVDLEKLPMNSLRYASNDFVILKLDENPRSD